MVKDYKSMTQEELENVLAEIVKKNYEKGVLLLDHNFQLKRLLDIVNIPDVDDIDDLICIVREMKKKPFIKRFFLKDTEKVDFRLVQIENDKVVELFAFPYFSDIKDEIMTMYLVDRLKDHNLAFGTYSVVQMINDKFVGTLAVLFYNENPLLDCAEDNDRAICEKAYASKDIYREALRKIIETKK